ncbi:MAG: efflux RND transporter periplasmic adaptor subunit [Bacteroidota bacterium]
MKKLVISGMLLTGILIIYGCMQPEAKEATNSPDREYPVKLKRITLENITRTVDYTANFTAFEEVYLAPASPGRIEEIFVDVGDRVRKGQSLVRMDRNQFQQANIQLQNARSNYLRLDTLYGLGSVSEQQYEQAKTQYEVTLANVDFLKENTQLESPINGVVTACYYEAKEMYSGAPNTPAGKAAVITLMQIDPLKAFVNISERYFPEIKKGMKAGVRLDMYPNETFEGKIHLVHPTVDETTKTFKTEIIIDNPDERLRPGMFARVFIEMRNEQALVVPAIAVRQQEGTNNRYIDLNDNGTARKINVTLGKRFDDRVEIISEELHEGQELVVSGQANLMEEARIRVVEK